MDHHSPITIFDLAERRLDWLDRRQVLLAKNIANLDTPGASAQDLKPFSETLTAAAGILARTASNHLPGSDEALEAIAARTLQEPDGNKIDLEGELRKVADTQTEQQVTLSVFRKYKSMLSLALGHTSG